VAKNKSPEQLKEDDDRTTSMGLFNQAEAYRLSARALEGANGARGHHPPVVERMSDAQLDALVAQCMEGGLDPVSDG